MAQTLLAFDPHPADSKTGFDIGWDHAHHGLVPPPEQLLDGNPVRLGWQAGKACFGAHTLGASRRVRQWLGLRLHAWQRGICFELGQVTPHYLGQIEVALCPVTRQRLSAAEASVDRVCDNAGYAAGNLATMSVAANRAKGSIGWEQALANAQRALGGSAGPGEYGGAGAGACMGACMGAGEGRGSIGGRVAGLDAAAWSRLAVLISFVTPLPHAQAARLPLLLTPPNRLRLLNPIQGLQALLTRELGRPDGTRRLRELAAQLPGEAQRLDFSRFLSALLPRLMEAGRAGDAWETRHALEDAWRDARVNRCWQRFALQLDEASIDKLLQQFAAAACTGTGTLLHERATATEGWALASRGRVTATDVVQAARPSGMLPQPMAPTPLLFALQPLPQAPALPRQARIGTSSSRTADGHLPA